MTVVKFENMSSPSFSIPRLNAKSIAVIPASEPIPIPDVLPPSLYSLDGMLAATLLVRALIDFMNSKHK